ncbi:MAG: NADH-quinone oxidoreductase subunit M [Planctomycetes bacterium]|nr:NADH-quinone oxidoreductase subunit M [Planctomycetota bacterium]
MQQVIDWQLQSSFPILGVMQLLPLVGLMLLRIMRNSKLLVATAILLSSIELLLTFYLYHSYDHQQIAYQFREQLPLIGALNYHAAVDGISVLFLLLSNVLVFIISIYGPVRGLRPHYHFQSIVIALQGNLIALFVTLNLLLFVLVSIIQLILCGYLLWRWATSEEIKDVAFTRYLQFMGSGMLLLMIGTLILGWQYAHTHQGIWSFDLLELQQSAIAPVYQHWIFFMFFYGFAIRIPLFPLHGWLPQAAEFGTISVAPAMLLGLKTGIYGLVRFVYPLLPQAVMDWQVFLLIMAVAGIFYAALLAILQENLRRMMAFAVISHTSIVMLGLLSLHPSSFQGAVLLTINFGLATSVLLFMIGLIYIRTGTTLFKQLGGLFDRIPVIGITFFVAGLAIVGMPGTPGFDAAHLLMEGAIERFGTLLTIAAALGNVIAAGFLLWAFQRAFLAPVDEKMKPVTIAKMTTIEFFIAGTLLVVMLGTGFFSEPWLELIEKSLQPLNEIYGSAGKEVVH